VKRLVVIPADPLYKYVDKGEIKARYWNPCGLFDEVHIISLAPSDVEPQQVQELVGEARLYIHAVGRPTALTLVAYYVRVRKLIGGIAPDLIRAHGPWHTGSLATYAGRSLGIPCLVSVHNDRDAQRSYDRSLILRLVKPLENYTLRNASIVICVSNYLHRYARAHGARRTITVYNKVYLDQFLSETPSESDSDLPTVLSVMRLDRQKYPECIIEALAELPLRLKLIGQGELQDSLRHLVQALGMEDRVEFVPMVPNREIHAHYLKADIFAMSTHYEGFCIPVLEAMAAGLPVVACDTEPIPELMGGTGIVVEKKASAFAAAFSRLAADVSLRRQLGAEARKRAQLLSGDRMEEREASLYEAVIAGRESELEEMLNDVNRFVD
jgi:glycosyltransferase involved in cell wall biosynthesis